MKTGIRAALSVLVLVLCSSVAPAQERKDLADVVLGAFVDESQALAETDGLDLVWWIPPEYWESSFLKDATMSAEMIDQMMEVLGRVAILGVVQAEISPFGAFTFADRGAVLKGMSVGFDSGRGRSRELTPVTSIGPDLELLLSQFTPILAAAMGNLGENFHFFVFDNFDEEGNTMVSPYDEGALRVVLGAQGKAEPIQLVVELPIDALFVPRLCPNGKPAHVSWNYCPWDGTELAP